MIAAGSLRVFLAVSLVAAALCPRAWASAWALDPSATRIEFSLRNLSVARVDGTFRLASGHVTLDDEDPSRSTIEAVIDATSVEEAFPPGPFNQHFDLFVGTSAGAVTAAFVANGAQTRRCSGPCATTSTLPSTSGPRTSSAPPPET